MASQLFKIKKNQAQMMADRGYDIDNEQYLPQIPVSQFVEIYQNYARSNGWSFTYSLGRRYSNGQEEANVIYLDKPATGEIGKGQITQVIEELQQEPDVRHIIFILPVGLSTDARSTFSKLPSYRVEYFLYEDMAYNPTDHFLAPKHTLMTDEEVDLLVYGGVAPNPDSNEPRRRKVNLLQLSKISFEDPIAKYYGALPGRVMKINRVDLSGQTMVVDTLAYRYVSDQPLSAQRPKTTAKNTKK